MRSYPSLGGQVSLDLGKNFLLYGQGKEISPIYGLLRPSIKFDTSAVINTYDLALEFFPISFIGFHIGYIRTKSDFNEFPFYDCNLVACVGTIKRHYAGQKIALGYKSIIALGQSYIFKNKYDFDSDNQVAEFRYFTLAHPNRDQNFFSRFAFGIRSGKSLYLLVREYSRFTQSKQKYSMNLLTYVKGFKSNIITFGVGTSKSTYYKEGFSAVFQWKYTFWDSQKLF